MAQRLVLALALLFQVEAIVIAQVRSQVPGRSSVARPDGLCATFVLPQGYTCDEFVAETGDGFLLGLQRMSKTAELITTKKPVFLNHGMLSGGESWLLNPPPNSLPFLLADAGYDVWIGNSRTTNFSSGHVTLTRNDEKFWDWSSDELVAYDLPTMLQLVFDNTNSTIHYIGFSQGTQVVVGAFSEGHMLSLVDKVVLLAPIVHVDTIKPPMAVAAGQFLLDQMMLLAHVYEFNIHMKAGEQLLDAICQSPDAQCDADYMSAFTGANCCFNISEKPHYEVYEVQSTATKNLAHFAQQYRTNTFAKYDYGFFGNLINYHSIFPPQYDLSAIPSMPMLIIHGGTDGLSDLADVQLFIRSIKFSPEVLFLPTYGHLDFVVGTRANIDVYSRVLTFLAQPGL